MGFLNARPLALALAAGACLAASAALADDNAPREATITVSGNGEARATPDMAVVTLSVTKQEKTARESLDTNNKAMTAVLEALKADGIENRDLQTSGFTIQPVYNYSQNSDGSQKPPELVGYQTTNSLTVRLRDISKAGALIDKSVTLGINQGGDIRFVNDNTDAVMKEAREKAMKDAIAKARELTAAAGVEIGRLVDISESVSNPMPMPIAMMAAPKEAAGDRMVPMAPGENAYNVTVNVTFAIKQ